MHPYLAAHRETLDRARSAIAERSYWSAYPGVAQPQGVRRDRRRRRRGRVPRPARRRLPARPARHDRLGRHRVQPVRHRRSTSATRTPTSTRCSPRRRPAMPAWRDAGPHGPGRRLRGDPAPAAPQHLRAGQRGAVHHRPGVRDGVPGRRRRTRSTARWRRWPTPYAEMTRTPATAAWEKPAGKGEPLRMSKTFHVVPARGRAGDRLQHVPDLELVPGPVRLAGHRQRRRGQAAPARGAAAGASPCRSRARCWPRPASTPTWCTLAAEDARRGPGLDAGDPARGAGSSTSPARPSSATGWRPTPGRRRSTPRRPASTRSWSTPPTTSPACAATSASR